MRSISRTNANSRMSGCIAVTTDSNKQANVMLIAGLVRVPVLTLYQVRIGTIDVHTSSNAGTDRNT